MTDDDETTIPLEAFQRDLAQRAASHLEHVDEYADGCAVCEDERTASDLAGTRSGALARGRVDAWDAAHRGGRP